jgi:hypothetical protein
MSQIKIPKFRTCRRLVLWMERNWNLLGVEDRRLPAEHEQVFFKSKREKPEEIAASVARYSWWAGALGKQIESLLVGHNDSVITYIRSLRSKECEIDPDLISTLAGDSKNLYRLSKSTGRLPANLEDTISDPRWAFMYAKEVLLGRLPRHLEDVFFKDTAYAAKYAFEVIRGFSPVKLPDELHAFMVMKSFEDPEDEDIRDYILASENSPDKVGNSVR